MKEIRLKISMIKPINNSEMRTNNVLRPPKKRIIFEIGGMGSEAYGTGMLYSRQVCAINPTSY